MARFYDIIGFVKTVETEPGVYEEQVIERMYKGEIIQNARNWSTADKLNDDLTINLRISILADKFVTDNCHVIRYAKVMGSYWKVVSIEPSYPRLTLTLGGVYNGKQA